jgi:hypothetical protein
MRNLLFVPVCALGLSGCVHSVDAPLSPTFGKAVAAMDVQIIPTKVSDQPPASSGAVAAAAVGRYEAGRVYKPETQATSDLANYGSGGGSGGGSDNGGH